MYKLEPGIRLDSVLIELTNACTFLRCRFCSTDSVPVGSLDSRVIPITWFRHVVKLLIEHGVKVIELSGGEPLLLPHYVFDVLQLAKEHDIRVKIFTSGIVPNILDFLYCIGMRYRDFVEVHFPLHGTKTVHAFLTQSDSHYDIVLKLCEIASRLGLFVGLHMVLTRQNCNYVSLQSVLSEAEKHGVQMVSILRFVPHGRGYVNRNLLEPSIIDYIRFYEMLLVLDRDYCWDVVLRLGCPIAPRRLTLKCSNIRISTECKCLETHICILPTTAICPCVAFKWLKEHYFTIDDVVNTCERARKFVEEKRRAQQHYYCYAQYLMHCRLDPAKIAEEIVAKKV